MIPIKELKNREFISQNQIPALYLKVFERFLNYSINGKLSIKSCRLILSWDFKLKKDEARRVLKELKKLGLIEFRSNHTILLNAPKELTFPVLRRRK